jgi:hypothetical protein
VRQSFPKDRLHLAAAEAVAAEEERGAVARRVHLKPVLVRHRRFHLLEVLQVRQLQRVNVEAQLEVEALRLPHNLRRTYRNTAAWSWF